MEYLELSVLKFVKLLKFLERLKSSGTCSYILRILKFLDLSESLKSLEFLFSILLEYFEQLINISKVF